MFRSVTVSSEFGSAGPTIAGYVAETFGWKLLDGALIAEVAQTAQVAAETAVQNDEQVDSWWRRFNRGGARSAAIYAGIAPDDAQFFDAERTAAITCQIIEEAAEDGDCVIVGRGGHCVLQDRKDVLHVFIYGLWAERIERVRGLAPFGPHIEELILATDRERAGYVRTYYGCDWKEPHLYHMMLSSTLGRAQAGWMIIDAIEHWGRAMRRLAKLETSRKSREQPMNVFVINAGSSSLKFQVIATDLERIGKDNDKLLCRGQVERIGGEAIITVQSHTGGRQKLTAPIRDVSAALDYVLRWLASDRSGIDEIRSLGDIHAVGHRVVHGGELFKESAIIDDDVLKGIEECIDLAPLHNPNNLKGIRAVREIFGQATPQVAVFDTAFHTSIPEHAYLYALPYHLYRRHRIRRYGFHGTSHRYVAFRYRLLHGLTREQTHVITLHLGNGCSAAAIREGRPVDTSMGMTPLEGLVMGTRSGDLDPAIVNLIATKEGLSTHEVDGLLNTQSGLLGISGLTNDMKVLEEELREHDDRRVRLAIEVFCYRARKYIGAFLASMGGADAVVFTGGIGENSPEIRARICAGLEWAGLTIEASQNSQTVGREGRISPEGSRLHAWVIPTNEELLIARDTVRCILGEPHAS
jgi:acetate kinase